MYKFASINYYTRMYIEEHIHKCCTVVSVVNLYSFTKYTFDNIKGKIYNKYLIYNL